MSEQQDRLKRIKDYAWQFRSVSYDDAVWLLTRIEKARALAEELVKYSGPSDADESCRNIGAQLLGIFDIALRGDEKL